MDMRLGHDITGSHYLVVIIITTVEKIVILLPEVVSYITRLYCNIASRGHNITRVDYRIL